MKLSKIIEISLIQGDELMLKNIVKKINPLIPDKIYLKMQYRYHLGKKLDINKPKTFNEKLQWLKLYDRRPEYTMYVDKYAVREHISKTIGEEYLIPLIGVYDSVEEIDWDDLPDKFVLKCTHGSSCNIICNNKSKLNIEESKKRLEKWMNRNWYWYGREFPYKHVKPRIICEEFLGTEDNKLPSDYKFFCFHGKPDNVMVCIERETGSPKFYFFNNDWELLRYNIAGKNAPQDFTLPKPKKIDEMFKIVEKISKGLPFSRIDLYYEDSKIYFGEITFFPESGYDKNLLEETDLLFGEKINLKKIK